MHFMGPVTDEMLMAYADGALSGEDAEAVERLLREGDVESREAVEAFRRTATLVRAAFADDANEPIPPALVQTVLGATAKPSILPFPRRRFDRYAMAIAASLAAVVVVGALSVLLRPLETPVAARFEVGPVPAGSQLANVLSKVPASTPVESEDGTSRLMVVSTFRDRSDRICREVEAMDASLAPQQVAVACRAAAGDGWLIEGVARVAAASDSAPGYAPAGAPEQDALKGLNAMLGAKAPLSVDEERRLIERGWQ
jgi:hypothetical protein